MEKYVPDIYQTDIYKVDYENLKERGIKCLIYDLDNTLVTITETTPREEVKVLFKNLKEKGFKIFIVSNSIKSRVKPFADELKVDYLSSSKKPNTLKLSALLLKSRFGIDEIAIIGDSMMDDIVCGNEIGITTVLIDQIGKKEFPMAKIKRFKERKIQKKLRDKDLFTKGRYYA